MQSYRQARASVILFLRGFNSPVRLQTVEANRKNVQEIERNMF